MERDRRTSVRHRPERALTTQVSTWDAGFQIERLDDLAGEEPLQISIDGVPAVVTMRTPGDDFDLAVGMLVTEGLVRSPEDLQAVAFGRGPDGAVSGNLVEVTAAPGIAASVSARETFASSSCGVCGKTAIDSIRVRGVARVTSDVTVDATTLCDMPDTMRAAQAVFGRTGGLHAAALFDENGHLVAVREDIGRHNAVDKVVGHAWRESMFPLSAYVLIVSGRAGFEVVQKAIVAGIPILASVSAPSSLAVRMAREYGMTLVGFLRGSRFVVYSGAARIGQ
jgi:FdhD protein